MDYEELLKEAKKQLPEIKESSSRFEIPTVKGHIEGTKTVITNFQQIVDQLRRPKEQLVKFLQRELATPAVIDGPRLIFGRKMPSSQINSKIELYCKEFVLCRNAKNLTQNL